MASVTDVCNLALLKFGNKTISDISDGSKEANACKILYPLMRDLMLSKHPWNFAMRRADISSQLSTAPAFGYDYAYTLPVKCLRVWELCGQDAEWEVEGKTLLTNLEEEIYIRYIEQVTDAGYFTLPFLNCLSTMMGAELSAKLSDDQDMRRLLLIELRDVWLPEAMQLNAIEGNKPRVKGNRDIADDGFSWVTEGH